MFLLQKISISRISFSILVIVAGQLYTPVLFAEAGTRPLQLYPELEKFISKEKTETDIKEENNFWDRSKQGWFYYEKIASENEESIEEEAMVPTIQIDWDAFKKLQASEIREILKELKDFAISNTTPQNVKNYMVAQKISVNKAENFMTAWQDVLSEHPALDSTVERPASGYVSFQLENAKISERRRAISRLAQDTNVGLIYFHSDENYYSAVQKPVLEKLLEEVKWDPYIFINVDENPQVIDQYGLETLPEIWLVLQNGERARVTAGARTADVITEKLISTYEKLTGEGMFPKPFTFIENELSQDLDLTN